MEPTALYIGNLQVGWSSFIIVLAALVWLSCACTLISLDGGKKYVIWVSFPFMVVFSLLIARFLNWYCHPEMYGSLKTAMESLMDNSDMGGYEMPGVMAGIALSAFIAGRVRGSGGTLYLLDVMAPGTALGMGLLYLTDRFGIGCRGKVTFEEAPIDPDLLLYVYDGSAYRMALYFVQFLVLTLICVLTLIYKFKLGERALIRGETEGSIAVFFLLLLSAAEVPLDSARYDTSFLRSNGFVSFMQIISAVIFLTVVVIYSIRSVKAKGLKVWHWILWILFAAGLGGTIYCEYLVQRHGSWYVACYSWMTVCCIVMALCCIALHVSNLADAEMEAEAEPEKDAAAEIDTVAETAVVANGERPDDVNADVTGSDTTSFDTSELVLLDINNGDIQRFDKHIQESQKIKDKEESAEDGLYKESPEEKEYRGALAASLGIISEYEDDYRKMRDRVAGTETYAFNTETMNAIRLRYNDNKNIENKKIDTLIGDTLTDNAANRHGAAGLPAPRTTFPTNISVYTRDKRTWKKRRKR